MARIVWIDTEGNKQESNEYNDIKSLRSYINENRYKIKVVELLDCNNLNSLHDDSTGEGLFQNCIYLVEVKDVIGTSDVENMNDMFYDCHNLKSVSQFDTSSAKYMSDMFTYCMRLKSVPLFNTSNFYWTLMFDGCDNLKSYTLPCDEYNTRSSVLKSYGDYKKSEKMLKELNKLWRK